MYPRCIRHKNYLTLWKLLPVDLATPGTAPRHQQQRTPLKYLCTADQRQTASYSLESLGLLHPAQHIHCLPSDQVSYWTRNTLLVLVSSTKVAIVNGITCPFLPRKYCGKKWLFSHTLPRTYARVFENLREWDWSHHRLLLITSNRLLVYLQGH